MTEYEQGQADCFGVIAAMGLAEAHSMVDYLCTLDNSSPYALGFAQTVSDELIERHTNGQ